MSCPGKRVVIPDPRIPYRVVKQVKVIVWLRAADGSYVEKEIDLMPGWWIASPQVVQP
jgi:hypothetical protein